MTPRIDRAVNTLIEAVNKGILAKGCCRACLVGNLVAKGLGGEINTDFNSTVENAHWALAFFTGPDIAGPNTQEVFQGAFKKENVRKNIEATEFSAEELMALEFVFETNTHIDYTCYPEYPAHIVREDQVKGLEAAIEVMLGFDDVKACVQEIFTNHLEPVT